MKVGSSWADITPQEKLTIAGQLHVRYGEYTHDPLTVNTVVFDDGIEQVAFVSCDLCVLADKYTRAMQARCEQECGIPAENVIISCTHTHVAPLAADILPGEVDAGFIKCLSDSVVKTVGEAIGNLEEIDLFAETGSIEYMGFNRRGYHSNGKVDMYYGCWNEDFEGVEGPRDPEVGVIFGKRKDGSIKFVMPSFSTHPNALEGESFYSADIVGAVRMHLRKIFGKDLDVIYLTGAAGNTAPTDMFSKEYAGHWRDEEGWKRSGLYLGSEIVKIVAAARCPMPDPKINRLQTKLAIPMREYKNTSPRDCEHFVIAKKNWAKWIAQESPVEVRVNVVRLGDAAVCSNPAELYVEFGLEMKKNSPAKVTLISELTDGYAGYAPTKEAFERGGYSTWPAATSKLREDAGEMITAETVSLLQKAFEDT